MDHRDKLLKLVEQKGPLLPAQINKELNTNVLFASAMLSEMVDTKKLRLTSMKIGGSPLYYCPGQEEKLQDYKEKLNEKDQRTFELLRKQMILRDKDQEPLTRVSLREIKDFAVPLQVTVKDNKELFWKFYLVEDDTAEKIIKDYLEKHNYLQPKEKERASETENKEEVKRERMKESQTTISAAPESERRNQEPIETIKGLSQIQEREEHVEREDPESVKVPIEEIKTISDPELNYSYSFSYSNDNKEKGGKKEADEKESVPELKEPEYPEDDEFFARVSGYFEANGIEIEEFDLVRKGSEYDFTLMIPSPVGKLRYFCKAKSKKKMNDGDVSAAFVAGQMKQLPVLMLIQGEITNKAKEMVEKDFKSFVLKELE